MRLRDIRLKPKMMSGGLLPVLLAILTFVIAMFSLNDMIKSVHWVDHTHRAIRVYQEVYSEALAMEAGLRGFLVTGDESLLQLYTHSSETIGNLFPDLKKRMTSDDRVRLVNEAQELIETWRKNVAVPAIALRREIRNSRDLKDVAALVADENDKMHVGRLRGLVRAFVDAQNKALEQFRTEAAKATGVEEVRKALHDVDTSNAAVQHVLETYSASLDMMSSEREYLLSGKEVSLGSYNSAAKRAFELIDKQKQVSANNAAQLKSLQEMEDALKTWVKDVAEPEIGLRKQVAASKSFRDLQELVVKAENEKSFDKFKGIMGGFQDNVDNVLKEREKLSENAGQRAQYILVAGMTLTAVLAITISYILATTVTRPLAAAVALAEDISQGNLSRKLGLSGKDEVGVLGRSLNRMVESLREQMLLISEGINVLASSSLEISTTATQLGVSAAKTSAAVTETSTTVEQVKQAARISSEKARKVAENAQQAVLVSESGKRATEDTIQRMNLIKDQMGSVAETVVRLSEHSQRIEEIIAAVQDLADQSNLLAVNASIEAARAGDQGKGFAVVAQEIKSMADQSKNATEQVRSILEDTRKWVSAVVMVTEQGGKAVDAGVTQSTAAAESLQSLAQSVAASSQAATVIQTSNEQQFAGVDQVASAMASIEQSIQQTVAGTAQLEDASKRIADLGTSLKDLVQRYKT